MFMAGSETMKTTTATTITATTNAAMAAQPTKSAVRRFVGVRQRPSGRWVAEIKDSSQRVRLWLGTYDSPEEAARAYDEAARALRGENARTNFAIVNPNSNQLGSCSSPSNKGGVVAVAAAAQSSDGRHGLSFSSLKAKLSKNLQSIMARTSDNNKSSKNRVSDHFTFASIFHCRGTTNNYQYQSHVDMKNIENVVQPSIIVPPHVSDHEPSSWESSSVSDCSPEWFGFRQPGLDSDGSDIGEIGFGGDQGFVDQMNWWMDSPEMNTSASASISSSEGSRSKRFKVSSSVMIPSTFGAGSPYSTGDGEE